MARTPRIPGRTGRKGEGRRNEPTPNRSCDDEQRRWSGRGGGGGDDLYRDADADCRDVTPSTTDDAAAASEGLRRQSAEPFRELLRKEEDDDDAPELQGDDTKLRNRSCRVQRLRSCHGGGGTRSRKDVDRDLDAAPRRPEKLSEDLDEYDYFDTTPGFGDKLDDDLLFDGRR
ncbi:hypothetical protein U9M48_036722 [Paspalum notatum var. saurae]|uniref:Uncharacterized protein n=1 Tax=Paspalum notatum var. saurae TaxID=547442 RepID=A0AAQ3XBF6_PASNO